MSITVKVAGVDRGTYVSKVQPASYNDTLNGRGTGSIVFNVPFDQLATFRPVDGQTILIEEDLGGGPVARFGGFLVEPQANELPDEEYVIFSCGMQDNNAIADRRTINATFDEIAFEDIVDAIVSNASNDGLTGESITQTGVVAGAAISLDFPTIFVVEAFNDLAVAMGGWWWNIGHDNDLSFAPRTAVPAPGDLTGANTRKKTVKVRSVKEKYRNVQIVFGGKDDFTITAMFEDTTEIAARAALEGGTSGRYEHIEERQDILDSVLVEELAEDLVTRFGLVTLMFECVTRDPGYASGQEVDVTFPNLELNAEAFLIDSVSAQLVYTSEDGSDTEEIWYTITAITGDPFGGWMQHFRKRPGSSQERKIVPAPGVTVECDPGVVVHDPVPGPYAWFQASTTVPTLFASAWGVTSLGDLLITQRLGGFANADGCGGGLFPGFGGSPACFANRQMIAEIYTINEDNTIPTTPSFGASTDMPNTGSNVKNQIPISPDGRFALFTQMKTAGVDSAIMVYDISLNQFRGTVVSTMLTNSNWSEPIWVGDVVYFVDGSGVTIFIYDISDPDNPTETTFVSSVTLARSIVASPNGQVLYVQGKSGKLAALDISSPLAPVEDTVLNIAGGYESHDIHPDGTSLIMFRRGDASTIRWTSITMTLNGTDIAFSTNDGAVPGTISTNVMGGRGCIWPGGDIVIVSAGEPSFPVNSFKAYIFDASNIDVVTFVEALSYNHPGSGNSGPFRSLESAKFYMFFGGVTQQMTFSVQTFPVCKDLETQWPLQARFGGTGHKLYAPGDILYASGIESLARRAIGDEGDTLLTSDELPVWARQTAPNVDIAHLEGPPHATYDDLQNFIDVAWSSGWISGGALTDGGGTTVDVAAGAGFIADADEMSARGIHSFDWDAMTTDAIAAGTTRYIFMDYNGGTPALSLETQDDIDEQDKFRLGWVTNEAGTLHIIDAPHHGGNIPFMTAHAIREIHGIARADFIGGLHLGETGTRNPTLSAGRFFFGLHDFDISAIDLSGADRMDTYAHVAGVWTRTTGVAQWPNEQYDNGTAIQTMNNNRYAVVWFYVDIEDGPLILLYGQNHYVTETQAEAEAPWASPPERVRSHCVLAGRYVFQKSDATPALIQSAFDVAFNPAGISDHNKLANLPVGDVHTQYILADGSRDMVGSSQTFRRFNTGVGGFSLAFERARGSEGSEVALVSGDRIATILGKGWHSGGAFGTNMRFFDLRAAEAFTPTNQGSVVQISLIALGASASSIKFAYTGKANLIVGSSNAVEPATGTACLVLADGTAPASLGTNTCALYGDDVSGTVEAFAVDEAGNAAQLTPHNFELFDPDDTDEYPWSYFCRNSYLGKEIGVNFARLARLVQQLTGEKIIHLRNTPERRDWVDDQEANMRRLMAHREAWERRRDEFKPTDEEPVFEDDIPPLPELKQPPPWLKKRLKAKGFLNTTKATALRQELGQWKTTRGL